jgi:hypothetical protein
VLWYNEVLYSWSFKDMQKLIHMIMDYAPGDLALAEVVSALAAQIPGDYHWHITSVHSFDTVSTGFTLAQISNQSEALRPKDTLVYANCAPRKDRREARTNNEGEGLLYAVLKSGARVMVVNSGYSLSFVRDDLQELWSVNVDTGGSQFRSRDNFPKLVGQAARGDLSFLVERLNPTEVIPAAPESAIGYIDSFGNLKTTLRDGAPTLSALKPGQRVGVLINGVEMTATVAAGSFNVQEGDIALAPGSSGHSQKFWEIFQRGGSAWATFKKPRPGAVVEIKVAQ